jgi:uncharacterized protein (DUF488 family)
VTIYTISYEGRSLEKFLADLQSAGVRLLADVRENPFSRKAGFSKNALAAALRDSDIEYRHLRPLGCPKPIRDRYREDGDWDRYTRDFMSHLAGQQPALEELLTLATAQPTALLCYEADFNRCHRTYVARAAARLSGNTVCHITAEGLTVDATGPVAVTTQVAPPDTGD